MQPVFRRFRAVIVTTLVHSHAIGNYGNWWSATANDATYSWDCYMYYDSANVSRSNNNNQVGFSVRCVRDN